MTRAAHRRDRNPLRRKVLHVLLGVAAALVAMTGLAFAYWSAQGSGSASASTATLNAPTNVAGAASGSAVLVTWTGVTGPNAGAVTGYYVERFTGATPSAACGSSALSLLPAAPASCTDTVSDGTYT
jgi:hypothetical protein